MPSVGLSPDSLDLVVYVGDDWDVPIDFDDGEDPPVAVDMSGWTSWAAHIKDRQTTTDPLVEITVDTTDAATGRIVLSIAAADTRDLISDPSARSTFSGTWDLQATSPTGKKRTLFAGTVTATLDRTRV